MANENPFEGIQVDKANLYKEESFTDLKVATLRRLTPVTVEGEIDPSRPVMFTAETTLMSDRGPLPIQAQIEAKDLSEAIAKFPEAVQAAVEKLIEQAREMQRQQMSRIVVPGQGDMGGDPMMRPPGSKLIY
jgi:hypothetical protein